jgi:hypothetical protein
MQSAIGNTQMNVQIPQQLLESLQASFLGEAKRICRDAAKILKVNEKEMLQKVLPQANRVKLLVVDTNEAPTQCPALIQEESILRRCRMPTLLGTGRCLCHQTVTIPNIPEECIQLVRMERMEQNDDPLWCNEATGEVYDSSGAIVGLYKNSELHLYVLHEEEKDKTH